MPHRKRLSAACAMCCALAYLAALATLHAQGGQLPTNHLAKQALLQRAQWLATQNDGLAYRSMPSSHRKLMLPNSDPNHRWPGFLLPETERLRGVDYRGDMGRLRKAFGRYRASGNLTVVVVGGSISAGAGAVDSHSWVEYLEDWMHLHFNASRDLTRKDDKPGAVHVLNSAVPGTFSSYMSVCYNVHVPQTADIIVVEYALNDEQTLSNVLFDNSVRRPFERLLRHLLSYPNQPAVILLNAYSWFQMEDSKPDGLYYTGSDGEFHELATYYQLPTLSVKAACWRLMAAGVRGFNVSRTRARDDGGREDPALDQQLRGDVFYFDVVHPDGNTGHRAMADLVIQLFADATKGPSRRRPAHAAHNALPPPMIPGNWESGSDKCFIGGALQEIAVPDASPSPASFNWMNDQAPDKRAKWGFIASQPGAQIRLKLDTTTSAKSLLEGAQDQDLVTIEVAHLRSYAGMGMASVECLSGCTCSPTILDGHHQARVSLVALHEVVATQAAQCVLQVTVLAGTKDPTGGHKVKLTGVMVSDEGGVDSRKAKGLGVFGALDYVTSGLGPKNTFELRQTIHATL